MANRILGAGVIGLRMGNEHARGYVNNPHTRLIGLCDTDESLLASRMETYSADTATTDYRELLVRDDIDIISVVTPDYFHAEQSIAAMRAGKHVLCDKPMTLNLEEARAIIDVVKETGRAFMVGQVCRYAPGFVKARELIMRGDIGRLFLVESEYAHNYINAKGADDWRVDPQREPLIGGGCHAIDLLRWIAGDPIEAFAYANHLCLTDWPVNDCTMAVFKFPNDVIGKVMVSIGCVRPYTMRSVFYGTDGTIICDNTSPEIQISTRGGDKPAFTSIPVNIASHNIGAEIDEFVDCILNDSPVLTDVYEGARTVAAGIAAVESARTGVPVAVEII